MLYGTRAPTNLQIGYLADSNSQRRINPIISSEGKLVNLSETQFTGNSYPLSFLKVDTKLEGKSNSVRETSYMSFVTASKDVTMKTPWIDHYCPQTGQPSTSGNANIELQFSFEYAFKGVSLMNDIQKVCYP